MLSPQGETLFRAVVSGFDNIQNAIDSISGTAADEQLTVACTHEISHLYLLPRFEVLQRSLGHDKPIRIMTYEYDTMETALDARIDIVIRYDISGVEPGDRLRIVDEAVCPVASPGFIERHSACFDQGDTDWQALPFLDLSKHNYGWATWSDWFASIDRTLPAVNYTYFGNYVYLLEAAAAGRGLALGWRGLIDRHLADGVLVPVVDHFTAFDRGIYAVLTPRGRSRALAQQFLQQLVEAA